MLAVKAAVSAPKVHTPPPPGNVKLPSIPNCQSTGPKLVFAVNLTLPLACKLASPNPSKSNKLA